MKLVSLDIYKSANKRFTSDQFPMRMIDNGHIINTIPAAYDGYWNITDHTIFNEIMAGIFESFRR